MSWWLGSKLMRRSIRGGGVWGGGGGVEERGGMREL